MAIGEHTKISAKARYWWAVCYPENMIEDWKNQIHDIVQLAGAYCVHDKDLLKDDDEQRKVHVHIMIAFHNTTTYKNALTTFQRLSAPGRICCNKCEQIISVKYAYNYLIHDTDKCKEDGKHQYDRSERILFNNFDIGAYEQLSVEEQEEIFDEICDYIENNSITNFANLDRVFRKRENKAYKHVLKGHTRYFVELCKGVYLKKSEYEQKNLFNSSNRQNKIMRDKEFLETLKDEMSDIDKMSEEAKNRYLESVKENE